MRYNNLLYLLLLISIYSCDSADDLLRKAQTEIDNGKYRKAIVLLDKALIKKKYLSGAYLEKAFCYSQLNNDDSAIIIYNQLLSHFPNNTLTLYSLGQCYYRQNKFEKAIEYLNNALISKGYNLSDTIQSQMLLEHSPAAKEILGMDNKSDVSFSDIFYVLGLSYYNIRNLNKSYHFFSNCVSWNYMIAESYYMMGLCWLTAKKLDKACEFFTKSYSYGDSLAKIQVFKHCR